MVDFGNWLQRRIGRKRKHLGQTQWSSSSYLVRKFLSFTRSGNFSAKLHQWPNLFWMGQDPSQISPPTNPQICLDRIWKIYMVIAVWMESRRIHSEIPSGSASPIPASNLTWKVTESKTFKKHGKGHFPWIVNERDSHDWRYLTGDLKFKSQPTIIVPHTPAHKTQISGPSSSKQLGGPKKFGSLAKQGV